MRRTLLLSLLTSVSLFTVHESQAQNDRFAYAITDVNKDGAGWNVLRKLDLQTGQYGEILLNGVDGNTAVYDAATKKQLLQKPDPQYGNMLQIPFMTGVAAAAYDRKHNRIYFTPMFVDQLRYIDLKTMKVYFVTEQSFTKLGNMHNDEGKVISRMVIAPDGYGYAISNDANTFVRFSTGKKTQIEQLGALVDDQSNNGVSIHNRCSSYGGDMISDDKGNLYILSARNHVFKVNTDTKVATHAGAITGLSPNFTVNGAVVDGEGKLLVSSAVDASSYFVVNPADWSAIAFNAPNGIYRSSDLANSNFLSTGAKTSAPVQTIAPVQDKFASQIAIYPNPVTGSQITIQFNKIPTGNYTLELRDILGRNVSTKRIVVNNEGQVQTINLSERDAKGVYMVNLFDNTSRSVFSKKVVVQ